MPPLGVHERSGRAALVAALTWCPCSRACTPLVDVPTPRDDSGQQDVGSVALVDLDTRELELDLDPSLGRIEPLRVVHDGVETLLRTAMYLLIYPEKHCFAR